MLDLLRAGFTSCSVPPPRPLVTCISAVKKYKPADKKSWQQQQMWTSSCHLQNQQYQMPAPALNQGSSSSSGTTIKPTRCGTQCGGRSCAHVHQITTGDECHTPTTSTVVAHISHNTVNHHQVNIKLPVETSIGRPGLWELFNVVCTALQAYQEGGSLQQHQNVEQIVSQADID